MAEYTIRLTDKNQATIQVPEVVRDDTSTDVVLLGRKRLKYGKDLNNNLLYLLENFACPEDPNQENVPDYNVTTNNALKNPMVGQEWYNTTQKRTMHYTTEGKWVPASYEADIAAHWGVLADGAQIPKPTAYDGSTIDYPDCSFVVGPFSYDRPIDYFRFTVDETTGIIDAKVRYEGSNTLVSTNVNYMVVGIKENARNNQGTVVQAQDPLNYDPLQVTITPITGLTSSSGGGTLEANVTGGSGSFGYLWEFVESTPPVNLNITSPNSRVSPFTYAPVTNSTNVVMRVTVTDLITAERFISYTTFTIAP